MCVCVLVFYVCGLCVYAEFFSDYINAPRNVIYVYVSMVALLLFSHLLPYLLPAEAAPNEEEDASKEVPFDVRAYVEEFLNRDALLRLFAYFRVKNKHTGNTAICKIHIHTSR